MELYKGRDGVESIVRVVKASEAMLEGAFAQVDSTGASEADAVGDYNSFLIEGFRDKNGVQLGSKFEAALSTGALSTANTGNTFTAGSDNLTVDKVVAEGRAAVEGDIYTALLDATVNTTTGSGKPGYFIGVLSTNASKLAESTTVSTKSANTGFELVDNGLGQNSAVHPVRGGNWVLVRVVHIKDVSPATV
jgi:hypothetical protein